MVTTNITEQEIREIVNTITDQPNEEYIDKVKFLLRVNPELVAKLTDQQLRQNYIILLYNYEFLHENTYILHQVKDQNEKLRATAAKSILLANQVVELTPFKKQIEDLEKK